VCARDELLSISSIWVNKLIRCLASLCKSRYIGAQNHLLGDRISLAAPKKMKNKYFRKW